MDTRTSNATTTIRCEKSYHQGDKDGYTCTLHKYIEKNSEKIFTEIARTKSCIFGLEPTHEHVEYYVGAFNQYGSLPLNTDHFRISLNKPECN